MQQLRKSYTTSQSTDTINVIDQNKNSSNDWDTKAAAIKPIHSKNSLTI
jgi:hypothetical protein